MSMGTGVPPPCRVVLLDGQGKAAELQGLGIGEARRELRVGRYLGALGPPRGTHASFQVFRTIFRLSSAR